METIEKHLIFRIKNQLFTVQVPHVNSIIQLPRVFIVPQAPEFILGVINLEGDVIPMIDTGLKMKMGKLESEEKSQAIILQNQFEEKSKLHKLGFLVDEVCDVTEIDPRTIQALPTSKYEFDERIVDGMHKVDSEFAMQINVTNFFKGEIEELFQDTTTSIK